VDARPHVGRREVHPRHRLSQRRPRQRGPWSPSRPSWILRPGDAQRGERGERKNSPAVVLCHSRKRTRQGEKLSLTPQRPQARPTRIVTHLAPCLGEQTEKLVAICEKRVLDALLIAAHTSGGAKDQHEGMGGQNFPEPVSAERFGRRSGRLNRLRGESSYGFTSRSAVLFGRGRWQEGHLNS
jgi:hypothetical protein